MKDYYSILGITKSATEDDVKKAFRKLAHKYHPDKKGGDEAKFKEISEAYTVLSDKKKRAEYDAYGRTFQQGTGPGPGGFDNSGFGGFEGFQDFDFGDIFSEFFGNRGAAPKRGRDISIDLELTFKDSVFGVERRVLLTKLGICDACTGSGAKPGSSVETCGGCGGQGSVREARSTVFGSFTTTRECPQCKGRGTIPKETCRTCAGRGVARQQDEVKISVPAGINNGEMIRMPGRGEAVAAGSPGDLYIKIHVKTDPRFKREGNLLSTTIAIKLSDALLGATYDVETLDGTVPLSIPAGVSHGETLRIKGKGVPLPKNERGDFMVRLTISLPSKLSKKARTLVEDLRIEGL